MIHSCRSKTWIIGLSPLFPICKTYLTDANLGGSQNWSLYLGAISRQLFSEKSSIFDNWQGPKYASAYNQSILFWQLKQCHKAEDFALNTYSVYSHNSNDTSFGMSHTAPCLNLYFCCDTISKIHSKYIKFNRFFLHSVLFFRLVYLMETH